VALSQKHRSSLFTTLSPIVGVETVEALLSEFPANDLDTPATKEFVRAEAADVRAEVAITTGELKAEIAEVRAELRTGLAEVRAEIAEVRAELRTGLAELRAELRTGLAELRAEMSDRFRQQTIWMLAAMTANSGILVAILR
jgi:ribosomal protein L29